MARCGRPPWRRPPSPHRRPLPLPPPVHRLLPVLVAATVAAAAATVAAVTDATTLFGDYGAIMSGNLDVTDAVLEGPSLVMGKATLDRFAAGAGRGGGNHTSPPPFATAYGGGGSACDSPLHALAVVGRTTAKRGAIVGRAVLGAKSALAATVALSCAADVAAAAPAAASHGRAGRPPAGAAGVGWEVFGATGGVDISPLRAAAARAAATLCGLRVTGTATRVGSTLHLYPRGPAAHGGMAGAAGLAGVGAGGVPGGNGSCVDVFGVDAPPDALNEVRYYGVGRPLLLYRLRPRGARWTAMDMGHLDAGRTLHVMCGGGARLDVSDSVLRGGLLAPALHLAMVNSEWAGRLVVEHLRGTGVHLRYGGWEGVDPAAVENSLC